jgi:type III restriction enzyme
LFYTLRNDFQIYYSNESAYEPDFVVETRTGKYLCEPKRAADLEEKQVQEKARAARRWCEKANTVSAKPWKYLLIPHDWIQENRTFGFFAANCG